ncbi:MAG TPA: hypothetical protein VH062_31415 [Polyangiaceae bacterium]|jgi:hypothetical protein|nr:hypothetical protein [Polyangiaceae bacterium]
MSTSPSKLPDAQAVTNLLQDLLGKGVQSKKSTPPPGTSKLFVGTYVDDKDDIAAVCLCDLALAATTGAALVLIPAGAAAESTRAGRLPPEMLDNFREVLNVLASTFENLHVRFRAVTSPGEAVDKPIKSIMTKPSSRLDLEVAISGYAQGRLSLLAR